MKTILASASPRRRELLGILVEIFEICPAKRKEVITKTQPEQIVEELAGQKAAEIAFDLVKQYQNGERPLDKEPVRVIGADTIVVYEGQIFGKPEDEKDALRMLNLLQGNTHQVYTGVCVMDVFVKKKAEFQGEVQENVPSMTVKHFAEKTDVTMYPVSEEELVQYIATKEPMDKAGAYAVQGISAKFIKELKGDYFNVVGLPVARLYQECYKNV